MAPLRITYDCGQAKFTAFWQFQKKKFNIGACMEFSSDLTIRYDTFLPLKGGILLGIIRYWGQFLLNNTTILYNNVNFCFTEIL